MYKTPSMFDLKRDFEELFETSQEIHEDTIKNIWYQRLIKEIVELFAPML